MSCLLLFLVLFLVSGCEKDAPLGGDLATRLQQIPPGFPPVIYPEDNGFTLERWELGKKLFYDPVLSIDSSISCGSCHQPALAFADDRAFSPGVEDRPGVRNSPSLGNIGLHPYFLREGGVPTLEMQILVPIQEHNEFDHNIVDIAAQLGRIPEYTRLSRLAYDRAPDPFVITRSIAVFERTLLSGNSAYDQWRYQGKPDALNAAQVRGKDLFFSEKTDCFRCHGGVNFTTYDFENNGLYATYADIGRMRHTKDSTDLARFKIPSLRNAALTAPYMHDGSVASLAEVIDHYDSGGAAHPHKSQFVRPLGLSPSEKQDLIEFLESLTDEDFITNPDFQPGD